MFFERIHEHRRTRISELSDEPKLIRSASKGRISDQLFHHKHLQFNMLHPTAGPLGRSPLLARRVSLAGKDHP